MIPGRDNPACPPRRSVLLLLWLHPAVPLPVPPSFSAVLHRAWSGTYSRRRLERYCIPVLWSPEEIFPGLPAVFPQSSSFFLVDHKADLLAGNAVLYCYLSLFQADSPLIWKIYFFNDPLINFTFLQILFSFLNFISPHGSLYRKRSSGSPEAPYVFLTFLLYRHPHLRLRSSRRSPHRNLLRSLPDNPG